MTPTSDERREVAARLREQLRYMREDSCYDEDLNVVGCGNTTYRNIAWSVEPYGNFGKGNYVHIVERLADLIDPTCGFSEELRECLDAAGLSDCGENDAWNYWYQRLMNAYNESVERQIMIEQSENAKLREQLERVQPTDCEGNALDIADTVHMLRSEYDGDHEWEDVVTELVLTKWGGDRWIVRGSKGEAWACDCTKTGYDEDAYEASDDVEPFDEPTLLEVENDKLRELLRDTLTTISWCTIDCYPSDSKKRELNARACELGIEVTSDGEEG